MKISKILTKYAWEANGTHGTDKNRCRKWGHCYGLAYDHIFAPYKDKEIDLLEIGIEFGGSLLAWSEYFTKANISGVDIKDMVENKIDGVEYIISDVKEMPITKEYDIVIDDGSHRLSDVAYVVKNIPIKVGGVMIIEDCQAPQHWFEKIRKITNHSIELIDLREMYGQGDDYLIALRNYGYYN